jgi:ceramide glucosyltransferase
LNVKFPTIHFDPICEQAWTGDEMQASLAGCGYVGLCLLAGGMAYLMLAIRAVRRRRRAQAMPPPASSPLPPVSVLVPMHGAPPGSEACLRAVLSQDQPHLQFVFGFHSDTDPGLPLLRSVLRDVPDRDVAIVVNPAMAGSNPKNCNLVNMMPAARHDIVAMVDSDALLAPGDLRAICTPLAGGPDAGAVTCLYGGIPAGGLWSSLGAQLHDDQFIPSVLVDRDRQGGSLDICYGSVIALWRSTLDEIGGIASMANAVAQDHVIGLRLHRAGRPIHLAGPIIRVMVHEPTFLSLFCHELRWSRSTRSLRPLDHALSVFLCPLLPGAVLAVAGLGYAGGMVAATCLALRLVLHGEVALLLGRPPLRGALLVPLRDAVSFLVWAASLAGREVRWDGRRLRTSPGEEMRPVDGGESGRTTATIFGTWRHG